MSILSSRRCDADQEYTLFILKDHLGPASVVTDTSGNILGENRYYPYGETRLTTGTIFTDKLFTGQGMILSRVLTLGEAVAYALEEN